LRARLFVLGGERPTDLGDVVERLFRDEPTRKVGLALVGELASKGAFRAGDWRKLTDSKSCWDSARTGLVDVGLVQRVDGCYMWSYGLSDWLSTVAGVLREAVARSPSPNLQNSGTLLPNTPARQMRRAEPGAESTRGLRHRGKKRPQSGLESTEPGNGLGGVFEALAAKLNVTARQAEEFARQEVENNGLGMSAAEYAELYLGTGARR
jgi:hypothetical protein